MTTEFLEKQFFDNPCRFFADGSLYIPEKQCLVLSDLHLGKGASVYSRSPLPGYDTDDTLARLEQAIDRTKPLQTILLGDSFHTPKGADELPKHHLYKLAQLSSKTKFVWIEGNHDLSLPAFLPGQTAHLLSLGNLLFSHQPHWDETPTHAPIAGQIIGHYHPKARLKLKARALSSKCFFLDKNVMIMPAFGSFTGGLNILHAEIQKLVGKNQQAIILHPPALYAYPVDRRYFIASP